MRFSFAKENLKQKKGILFKKNNIEVKYYWSVEGTEKVSGDMIVGFWQKCRKEKPVDGSSNLSDPTKQI